MLDDPTVADERINTMDWRRWLPASGIAFVALIIIGVVIVSGSTPDEGASAEKISSFYNDNDVRQYIAAFLLAASAPFLVTRMSTSPSLSTSPNAAPRLTCSTVNAGPAICGETSSKRPSPAPRYS